MTFAASTTLHRWLFRDVERPLRVAPMAAFNRLFSRQLMAADIAPNAPGDPAGGVKRGVRRHSGLLLLGARRRTIRMRRR